MPAKPVNTGSSAKQQRPSADRQCLEMVPEKSSLTPLELSVDQYIEGFAEGCRRTLCPSVLHPGCLVSTDQNHGGPQCVSSTSPFEYVPSLSARLQILSPNRTLYDTSLIGILVVLREYFDPSQHTTVG